MGGAGRLVAAALSADRIRPASWLAAAAAGVTAAVITMLPVGPTWLPAILAVGGIAAVAAIGDPPRGVAGPAWAWVAGRAVWPAAAAVLGAAVVTAATARFPSAMLWAWATMSVAAVAATVAFRFGATAADAASLALASVAVGAVAAAGVPASSLAARGAIGVGAALVVPAVVAAGLTTTQLRSGEAPGPGAITALLGGVAMASTLAGMVAWLFLAPEQSGRYTLLVGTWFVVLAVPQSVLGCGSPDEERRRRLAAQPQPLAWKTAGLHAAVLGWPLVVAAVLAGDAATAADRLLVVAILAGAAGVTAAVTTAVLGVGGTRDTAFALVLGIACLSAAGTMAIAEAWANPAGNDVEQTRPSCKTPDSPQPDAAPLPV
jgi:hypothetical protein